MGKPHHYKRRSKQPAYEIDVTTFLNLMVVLVPFLLITAVFSRLTIVELDLPSSAGGPATAEESLRLEVVVREDGIEITDGTLVTASFPNRDGEFDLDALAVHLLEFKTLHPEHEAASVLMEAHIPYDYLIQVMDIVRSAPVAADGTLASVEPVRVVELFPLISVGDAP